MNELDEMAAEMRFVDLSDRVRQAHRRGVRRRLIGSGVTLIVALVCAVVGVHMWTQYEDVPAGELEGTLVTARQSGEELVVRVGETERMRLSGDATDLTVSGNGKWLAWRQSDRYFAAELDGGRPREIATAPGSCVAPAWVPGNEPVLVTGHADGGIVLNDTTSGDTVSQVDTDRERGSAMCQVFPVKSDGGYDLYYGTTGNFEIRYVSPEGRFEDTGVMKKLRDVADWEAITGLSADGRTACVRADSGTRRCDGLVDLRSGKLLRQLDAEHAWFLPDGGLLTAAGGELALHSAGGKITDRAAAPADAHVLAYFPR